MTWVRVFVFPRLRRSKKTVGYTKLLVDLYIVALLGVEIATLCFWAHPGVALWCKAIAAFGLIDVLGATCRDLIVASSLHEDDDGPFILVQDPIRWLLLMPLSALQVVICFAILYLSFGAEFEKTPIDNPMMAVYYSLVTFTTLGYGSVGSAMRCCTMYGSVNAIPIASLHAASSTSHPNTIPLPPYSSLGLSTS